MDSSVPTSGDQGRREDLVASLNRSIFMRESQHAARHYQELLEMDPGFRLRGNLQHDLARLLELGNEPRLALTAYESLIENDADSPFYPPSLRGAGHLGYRLKDYKKARHYLERFLKTRPGKAEIQDAEGLLNKLPDGLGVRRTDTIEAIDSQSQSTALPRPQPKLYDTGDGNEVNLDAGAFDDGPSGLPPTDTSFEELIAISGVEEETGDRPHEHPRRKLSFEDSSHHDIAFPPEQPPSGSELAPSVSDSFFGGPENPPTADDDIPESDPYSETPPLSISSRDIAKKQKRRRKPGDSTGWARRERQVARSSEPPAGAGRLWDRLQDVEIAMLLPTGRKIILDDVVRALMLIENLDESSARHAVLERKGLIRDGLTRDDVLAIYPQIRSLRQKFDFFTIEKRLRPEKALSVSRIDLLDRGLRASTEAGARKARWSDVRLISCGRLERRPTVDLFCSDPVQEFRLLQGLFDFCSIEEADGADPVEAARDFLKMLERRCPDATFSHTARNFMTGKAWRPQKFASTTEYDRYNMCLLIAHHGEQISARDLYDAAKAAVH